MLCAQTTWECKSWDSRSSSAALEPSAAVLSDYHGRIVLKDGRVSLGNWEINSTESPTCPGVTRCERCLHDKTAAPHACLPGRRQRQLLSHPIPITPSHPNWNHHLPMPSCSAPACLQLFPGWMPFDIPSPCRRIDPLFWSPPVTISLTHFAWAAWVHILKICLYVMWWALLYHKLLQL